MSVISRFTGRRWKVLYVYSDPTRSAQRHTSRETFLLAMGASGYFRLTFIAPEGFSSVRLKGFANGRRHRQSFFETARQFRLSLFRAGRDHGVWKRVVSVDRKRRCSDRHDQ